MTFDHVLVWITGKMPLEEGSAILEVIRERYLLCLKSYVDHFFPHQPSRFTELLVRLPEVHNAFDHSASRNDMHDSFIQGNGSLFGLPCRFRQRQLCFSRVKCSTCPSSWTLPFRGSAESPDKKGSVKLPPPLLTVFTRPGKHSSYACLYISIYMTTLPSNYLISWIIPQDLAHFPCLYLSPSLCLPLCFSPLAVSIHKENSSMDFLLLPSVSQHTLRGKFCRVTVFCIHDPPPLYIVKLVHMM